MEAQQQAARNVARRWLGKLKHRRVQQAAQLGLTVWLEGESQRDAAVEALRAAGATSTRYIHLRQAQTQRAWETRIADDALFV